MKKVVTRELLVSAVLAGSGLAFLYSAAYGVDRNVGWSVYWKLGCALGAFALAIQPGAAFEKVEQKGFRIRLPKSRGVASILNVLSIACLLAAALAWLAT